MSRNVYIGNGVTITVTPGEFKYYDWNKLQTLLDSGVEFEAGMKEDWFFTASKVTQEDIDNQTVGYLQGSDWATPIVEFENGKREECWVKS